MAVTRGPLAGRPFRVDWQLDPEGRNVVTPRLEPLAAPAVSAPMASVAAGGRPQRPAEDDTFDPSSVLGRLRGEETGLAGTPQMAYPEVSQADVDEAIQRVLSQARASGAVTGPEQRRVEEDIQSAIQGDKGIFQGVLGGLNTLISALPDVVERPLREGGADALNVITQVPGRLVQSAAKEITDIGTRGETPSLREFVTQPFDFEGFNPEYRPIQETLNVLDIEQPTGKLGTVVRGIDTAIDFGAKVLSDPYTYLLATPLKYQGAGGRNAAAQDFLQSRTATLLDETQQAKFAADIYRYGPDALPTNVRKGLVDEGVFPNAGLRWAGAEIPGTSELGSAISLGIGERRARLGDRFTGAATALTPRARVGLVEVARGATGDTERILSAFAANRAALAAKADAGQLAGTLVSKYGPLARQLSSKDEATQRSLLDYAERATDELPTLDPEVRALAGLMRTSYDNILQDYNAARAAFSDAHGLRLDEVPRLEDFVHRSMTAQARDYMASRRGRDKARQVARDFGVDVLGLLSPQGFTVGRTIRGSFLGVPLQTGRVLRTTKDGVAVRAGTINEINDIAVDQLGFKLFEDNAGAAFRNYLVSVARQFQRESFVNALFRFRPSAVAPLLGTGPTAQAVRSVINDYEQAIGQLERAITGGAGTPSGTSVRAGADEVVRDVANTARQVVAPTFAAGRKVQAAVRRLSGRLDELSRQVAQVRNQAEMTRAGIDRDALAVLGPLEARIRVLQDAIDAGVGAQEAAREWLLRRHTELFPDVLVRPTGAAKLADDILRDAGSRLSGAARAGVERRAGAAREAAGPRPMVDVAGEPVALPAARAELKQTVSAYKKAQSQYRKQLANDPTLRDYATLQQKQIRQTAKLDAAAAVSGTFDDWQRTVGDLWVADIADIRRLLDDMPRADAGAQMTSEWVRKIQDTFTNLRAAELTDGQRDALNRVLGQLAGEEAALAKAADQVVFGEQLEANVRQGLIDSAFVEDIRKGWLTIRDLQVQVNPELAEQIDGVYRGMVDQLDRAVADGQTVLGELWDLSIRYFKSTAVLTTAFTVRNAITAAWNNWVNGVSLQQMADGIRYGTLIRRYGLDGVYSRLPEEEAARLRTAMDAVFATGGGRNVDEIIPVVGRAARRKFKSTVADRAALGFDWVVRPFAGRLSAFARGVNEDVEIAVARLPLALNGVDQGFSTPVNAARIARNQFDYTDLSQADEAIKRFIPFWVFSSRNIPLQLVNRVIKPGPYLAYERLRDSEEQDPRLALWRAQRGPIPLLGGFLDLDLPFQTLEDQFRNLTSLSGWLGQAAPQIRIPIEIATGQRIAFGEAYPYSSEYEPVDLGVGDLPASLFAILSGQTERTAEGQLVAQERVTGPVRSALPATQNLQRYAAAIVLALGGGPDSTLADIVGGPEDFYERDTQNLLFQLSGINYYRPTPEDISKENRRQIAEVQQLERELSRLGFLP